MAAVKYVDAHWDADAGVWWAESDDIPGLVTEAPTFEAMIARAGAVIPDLLDQPDRDQPEVVIEYRGTADDGVMLTGHQTLTIDVAA